MPRRRVSFLRPGKLTSDQATGLAEALAQGWPDRFQIMREGSQPLRAPARLVGHVTLGRVNRTRIASRDCDCVQRIAATCGESPMWSVREQALYWTDNLGGRIYRLEPERGSDQSFVLGQNVMAIGLRECGGLVLALAKQLAFYEPEGQLELLMGVEQDQPRNRFNDGKVDRRGRYWAGTMNDVGWDKLSGSLYRLDPGLELSRLQDAARRSSVLDPFPRPGEVPVGLQLPLLRLAVLSLTVVAAGCSTIDAEPPPAGSPNQLLSDGCDPSYPDFCIPPPPPDLDCKDVERPVHGDRTRPPRFRP